VRELILHVGMHKTGTTSIQRSLHGLPVKGVRYVDLGHANHSNLITAAFSDVPDKPGHHARHLVSAKKVQAVRERTLRMLDAELSRTDVDKFVISGEGIVKLRPPAVEDLRDKLLTYVDRVHVFAYMREPVGFSTSALQQRVKGGMADYELPQPEYRKKFARFIDVFGASNVTGRPFAKERLKDGSVVVDFCDLWGIPFDPAREVRSNESLSEPVVKFMHLFNREGTPARGRGLTRARRAMAEELRAHFKGRFELPARFHGAAVDSRDVEWLARRFGIDFSADLPAPAELDQADFEAYLQAIDPAWVASYRELLSARGLSAPPADDLPTLLNRHFAKCVEEVMGSLAQRQAGEPAEEEGESAP
jgi:hypothetical protein